MRFLQGTIGPWTVRPLAAVLLVGAMCSSVTARPQQVSLGEHGFEWTTVDDQDQAHFRWSAEVINAANREFAIEVVVDLLDDEDGVLLTDSTGARIGPGETMTVEHAGALSYDRAADVVLFRFRVNPSPPEGR